VEHNDSLPADEKLGGLILTCANDRMPDEKTMATLDNSGIPTISVSQDTAETDATFYKCFSNTKLQLYDKEKHRRIVSLFAEHFDTARFLQAFGL
jgi:BioD-like phosphotransacetylase family protein